MNDMLERQKSEFEKKRSRRKLWHKTVSALAAVTVFVTAYSLILPAITMESPACGKEEHTHTQECYEVRSILTCGQEETPGHKHDETCYDAEGNLICGQEEKEGHTHTAECYTTEKVLVCDKEEHVHDESCYPVKEPEENEPEAEPETTPPEAPSGDPTADLESRAKWESTFSHLALTGDWAKDVLAIADTQLGYTESAANYITEDGRRKGYTRYGAWYGDSYGDWCAMFVSFCLHYAGVDTDLMPVEADCVKWVDKLIKTEIYHRTGNADDKTVENYEAPEPYQLEPGDLIFFDWENDGKSNHVGLVYEIIKDAEQS